MQPGEPYKARNARTRNSPSSASVGNGYDEQFGNFFVPVSCFSPCFFFLLFSWDTRDRLKELYQETAVGNPDSGICRSPPRAVRDCIETLLPQRLPTIRARRHTGVAIRSPFQSTVYCVIASFGGWVGTAAANTRHLGDAKTTHPQSERRGV